MMANADIPSNRGFGPVRLERETLRAWSARATRWLAGVNIEGTLVLLGSLIAWQVASFYLPPILFPSLQKIADSISAILTSPAAFAAIGTTYLRILGALLFAVLAATTLGIAAGVVRSIERAVMPLIELSQGIPAVCWIIFAILWFRDMEVRIAFVVVVTTVPSFFYQARDGVRGIPAELWDMVRSWRPSLPQLVRILVVPALLPALLTGWRINLGNGTRVTIMAELLGGVSGIGYQLRLSQELFRMDRAIAWTAVLVAFVVATNLFLSLLEKRVLTWRDDRSMARG
jgi:NitT/TauT family transport system permease protein